MRQAWMAVAWMAVVLAASPEHVRADDEDAKAEVIALYMQAQKLKAAGKTKEAAKLYETVVEKAKGAFGAEDVTTAKLMLNLAGLYEGMGRYAKAEPLYERSLNVIEAKLGEDHPDMATALNNLAGLYSDMGRYEKAEPLYERSLKIFEAKWGKDHPVVARTQNNLAVLYERMGQYAKAEPLYKRSLASREARLGKDHPDVAISLSTLAGLYTSMGRYAKAEPLHERSLAIREARLGKDHPDVATSLHNLALLYQSTGRYAKAEPLYERSLEIKEAKLGKDNPSVATSLNNLAGLYESTGQYAKAVPLFKRSLAIKEARLGKDHPDVATSLSNLAGLYQSMGRYAKAEPLYERSLEIREASLGKDHPDVATSLNNLALLYQSTGRYAKAEPLYERSLEIFEAKLGKDHPSVATSLNNLALLSARTGAIKEAGRRFDRARRGARQHVASVLPTLADSEKAAYFTNTTERSNLEGALSLGLSRDSNADLASLSAAWLLNGKALDQEALASSALLARQGGDPRLGELARELVAARQKLSRLTFATPRPGREKQHLEQIDLLRVEEQRLSKQLRQAGGSGAAAPWVELADLRKALPRDAVLIDIARFEIRDFKAKVGPKQWQAARYVAWLTSRSGPVRVVDLGPADAIDAAVKKARTAFEDAGKHIKEQGEEKAAKELNVHLAALSKLILAPLLPHAGKSKTWLLSPDAGLWLVPWEALPLPGGRFAVEEYRIGYLTSGRDLIPGVAPRVEIGAPMVIADPDYDLGSEGEWAKGEGDGTRSLPRLSDLLQRGGVKRLPGAAAEAKAITPTLRAYAGVKPLVYLRAQAITAAFTTAESPRVVVLCTHGFFLPGQEAPREAGPGKPKVVARWENPLLRCGLLLAGCNKGGGAGVLTGMEVVGTDLRGCELVVLSACETGLGDVQSGEGVAGLRQAFQLAGAKAVVSTLWSVPDKQSARLMTLFFATMGKGAGKAEALRAAKLAVIAERRDDFGAAHPFFWAAFTLTGAPDAGKAE